MAERQDRFPPEQRRTAAQAAEYLGVRPQTLTAWRRDGKGPPFYLIGGRVHYLIGEIDDWILASSKRGDGA